MDSDIWYPIPLYLIWNSFVDFNHSSDVKDRQDQWKRIRKEKKVIEKEWNLELFLDLFFSDCCLYMKLWQSDQLMFYTSE